MSTDAVPPSTFSTAGLVELKVAFDKALEERQVIDHRIEEIRKAIAVRLKEAQNLNNEANSIASSGGVVPIKISSESFEISTKSLWRLLIKYVLPAILMFAILWFVVSFSTKSELDTEASLLPSVPTVVVDITNGYTVG